jgi:hypothetical protein
MIGDLDSAKHVSSLMLQIAGQLDESVRVVQGTCSEQEYSRYRQAVGRIMGEVLVEVLNPLYSMHPSLAPCGFK